MEKNTKILIGVGIAAVAAYFVYRSKSKPKTQTGGDAVKGKCPEGYFYARINCIKAPCPEGECLPMDMMPEKPEPSTEPSRGGKLFDRLNKNKTCAEYATMKMASIKTLDYDKAWQKFYDDCGSKNKGYGTKKSQEIFSDDMMPITPINYKAEQV